MLTNYLKIAWRTITGRTGYSAINIIGLAVGLAACLLIALYVQDEMSYDTFHEDADRSYRVLREFDIPDLQTTITTTPTALAQAVKDELPAVEHAVRVQQASPVVSYGDRTYVETGFLIAESGFFDIFSFPLVRGEIRLEQPYTLLITESSASKYFGTENPIGKSLGIGNTEMEVTGILADLPANTHLQFDFIAALEAPDLSWGYNNMNTYVKLRSGQSKTDVAQQMTDLIQQRTDPDDQRAGNDFIPHLQPVTGIHLGQGVSVDIASQGNILYLYLFMALAAFIILLAAINYMNLATARSAERAREIGLRKTLGAGRSQIVLQFLGESVMTTLIALVVSLGLLQLALPLLNELAGKSLEFNTLLSGSELLWLLLAVLFVGVAAGGYPAAVLSGFSPSRAVKGESSTGGGLLRRGLVVFQFAISISLIAATGIVYQQLEFMRSSELGFNPENVLIVERANFLGNSVETLKEQIATLPGVESVGSGYSVPGTFYINSMWQPDEPGGEAQNLDYTYVGFDYAETLDFDLLAGRSFSRDFSTDSTGVILNESAAREYGWSPEQALGKRIGQGERQYTVIGVARNYHYESLHNEIYSLAMFGPQTLPRYIAVRLMPADIPAVIGQTEELWAEFSDLPFQYSFLADDLAQQYRSESRLTRVFTVFALLAVLIGCLGLMGLAAFLASQRRKEIGIRKVLGATVGGILALLSSDFIKLVGIGFLVAVPLTWIAMDRWLADYAYSIEIGPGVFLVAGVAAMLIAILTVSWQSLRAALADPAKSLRTE